MSQNQTERKQAPPNERIIVGNLSYDTDEQSLEKVFSQFGEIKDSVVVGLDRGKSRGFGFVAFASVEEATKAVEAGSQEIDGRATRVDFANKKSDGPRRNRERAERPIPKGKKVYVGSLPWNISAEEFKAFFEKQGEVEDAFISVIKYASEIDGYLPHKGFGFVTFVNEEDADKVVKNDKLVLKGRTLSLKKAKPQADRNRRNNRNGNRRDRDNNNNNKNQQGRKEKKVVTVKRHNKNTDKPAAKSEEQPKQEKKPQEKKAPVNDKQPRIVTDENAKNPWKKTDSSASSANGSFPSLNKKADGKGKEEKDN